MRDASFAFVLLLVACGAPARPAPERPLRSAEVPSARALLEQAEGQAQAAEASCEEGQGDCPDYGASIDTLSRLIRAYPGSDEAAAALEPLGWFLSRQGRFEQAAHAWLSAVCPARAPDPLGPPGDLPAAAELASCEPRRMSSLRTFLVWFRLGELCFDEGDLGCAHAALERAVAIAPEDPRYAEPARYKLAWTLYRMDRYVEALEAFAPLTGASQLGQEAMQYMAIILAEPDWDGDGADDARIGVARPEAVAWSREWAHAPELVLETADVLFDAARYADVIAACAHFLALWPDDDRAADARALLERARAMQAPAQRK